MSSLFMFQWCLPAMRRFLHSACVLVFTVCCCEVMHAQAPIGEVFAADSSMSGTVLYAGSGTQVLSGSQVAAGGRAAMLKLARGGEVRICPNTSIVVSASPNGHNLLFSLNEGDVEFHFDISSEADAVQTPDFRIQFAGPGRFDLAMCTDKQGGLALRGNNSSRAAVIVREMMGDGVYQVPAGQSVDFSQGSVQDAAPGQRRCGCPEQEVLPLPEVILSAKTPLPTPPGQGAPSPVSEPPSSSPPPAATSPVETHVQVDAPFVYHGDELKPESEVLLAHLETVSVLDLNTKLTPTITPPKPTGEKKGGGFFKKLGSFFGRMFKG